MATIYSEYQDLYNVSGTVELEPIQPITTFHVIANGNVTFSVTDLDNGEEVTLVLEQDATGGRTFTFSTEFKFPGGTVPTLTTTAGAIDVLKLVAGDGVLRCLSISLDIK